jgi:electron transfer flavoprotein alpha subunit
MIGLCDFAVGKPAAQRLEAWGMERVRKVGAAFPPHPIVAGKHAISAKLASEGPPRAFLFAADAFGKVAGPLWAAQSGSTLITGCTGLTTDGSSYVVARPTHGEQFEALVSVPLETALVATLVPGSVGTVTPPMIELKQGAARRADTGAGGGVRIHPPDPATLDITDAERIVAFGRGAFNSEAVALVERLAEGLGAVVAGTRPAADEGWLPFSRQVGLTGAIVHPKLYVAVGISGAPYHMVGIKDAEHLIAINSDPEAPIFANAQLGIVGNLYEVLPRLIADVEAGKPLHKRSGARQAEGSP